MEKSRAVRILGLLTIMALALTIWAPLVQAAKSKDVQININTASVQELTKLPRVGEKVAQRIVEYRTKNGPFKSPEDIMKVSGIGEKTFAEMKPQILIAAPVTPSK